MGDFTLGELLPIGVFCALLIAAVAHYFIDRKQGKQLIQRAIKKLRSQGFSIAYLEWEQIPDAEIEQLRVLTHPEFTGDLRPTLYKATGQYQWQSVTIYHITGRYIRANGEIFGSAESSSYLCLKVALPDLKLRISTFHSTAGDPFYNRYMLTIDPNSCREVVSEFSVKTNAVNFIRPLLKLIDNINLSIDRKYVLYLSGGNLAIYRQGVRTFLEFDVLVKIAQAYEPLWASLRERT